MYHTDVGPFDEKSTSGVFNYLDDAVHPSLLRNGRVLTKRDPDGNDYGTVGLLINKTELRVCNARISGEDAHHTCDANGFELLNAPLVDEGIDFFDNESIVRTYYGQCARLVAENTGARAYPFDHNIRSVSGKQSGKRITGGQQVQEPLHFVHGDYTLSSAPQRLHDLTRPPSGNDTLCSILQAGETLINPADARRVLNGGRFAIINVWRNIIDTPVSVYPLALCDSRSVDPQDLVVFEIHYQDRIGENYFARHSASHRWYYYPQMARTEALLIKQWDSAGTLARSDGQLSDATDENMPCTFSFHSAFEDPASPPDAPDRCSIEVRCMVIYD
ncbi:MAG: CmcJ/NvfI family oxidoreductase [Gammaproteobacteria bacterium]|nr:CmcJ/NvfI family oxidoreductase [Gammaproteobacteria bacterium]